MIAQAASTTGVLLLIALISKVMYEDARATSSTTGAAVELLQRAIQWREYATQDGNASLRLQHAAMAAAMLEAARSIARERDLERAAGIDVSRLARSMDAQLTEAREAWSGEIRRSTNSEETKFLGPRKEWGQRNLPTTHHESPVSSGGRRCRQCVAETESCGRRRHAGDHCSIHRVVFRRHLAFCDSVLDASGISGIPPLDRQIGHGSQNHPLGHRVDAHPHHLLLLAVRSRNS